MSDKSNSLVSQEELREALAALDRMHRQEVVAREETEILLGGLKVLVASSSVSEMLSNILQVFKKITQFEEACIFVTDTNGNLQKTSSTAEYITVDNFTPQKVFQRALSGRPTSITNLKYIPDWEKIRASDSSPWQSAMIVPLSFLSQQTLIFCVHSKPAFFKKRHTVIVQSYAPLVTQSLQRSHEKEKLQKLVERLDFLAYRDTLTKLHNRESFNRQLTKITTSTSTISCRYALMMIDLDNFKQVNDTLGHPAGDYLLKEIAQRFLQCSTTPYCAARFGGDEFSIIMEFTPTTPIEKISSELLQKIRHPVYYEKHEIYPQASIGISIFPDDTKNSDTLIQYADIALYWAKEAGKNRFCCFESTMQKSIDIQKTIEDELRIGLREKQFTVFYQPIYHLSETKLTAVEALVRWNHPTKGLVGPGYFIHIAERSGQMIELSEYIVTEVCQSLHSWLQADTKHRVAINISGSQLFDTDHLQRVKAIISSYNIPFGQIELELSEDIIFHCETQGLSSNVKDLYDSGFTLAFDDFGTGHSTLASLRLFPVSRIKIDRSFVNTMLSNNNDLVLVKSIIDLGKNMGLSVVAEGVESKEQLDKLRSYQCDEIQGYLLGKPMSLQKLCNLPGFYLQNKRAL